MESVGHQIVINFKRCLETLVESLSSAGKHKYDNIFGVCQHNFNVPFEANFSLLFLLLSVDKTE